MENSYVMEMLKRQRIEETLRAADRERLIRQAQNHRRTRPLLQRVAAALNGGRIVSDATGSREVPGL